nr:MAG TPA: hypothetical protein [Myoviridae sp. ctbeQ1]
MAGRLSHMQGRAKAPEAAEAREEETRWERHGFAKSAG